MAFVKLEPSGCVIHKGNIQVRLSMYLEPADARYSEHHVFVVDETSPEWLKGYPGEVKTIPVSQLSLETNGSWTILSEDQGQVTIPADQADYDAWLAGLPHIWRDNPFHNHFIYVDGSATDAQIQKQAQDYLAEFYAGWSQNQKMEDVWHSKFRPRFTEKVLTSTQVTAVEARLSQLKSLDIAKVAKG